MDTKWFAAAGAAAVLAFGGALYLATPATTTPEAPKSDIKAPTIDRAKSPRPDARARSKAGGARGKAAQGCAGCGHGH